TRMVNAAKKAEKILHINQTLHYWPPYIALAEMVANGKIGTVRHVRCLRFHSSSPDIGWSPGAKWFVSKEFDGGIVLDIGVHMADVMRWIAGPVSEIIAVTDTVDSSIDVVDNARALMRFENGATGVLELSWTAAATSGLIEVYGSKGTLRMGFAPDGKTEFIRENKKTAVPVVAYPKSTKKSRSSQQAFVDALPGKKNSPTPGELGREAIALCEAILKSGKTNRYIKVKHFD
ncbi:MAG: Gfo/Idh/MocA family oxidoreductase, partial [Candidatus Hydrogenedentes bacterium]|nr:Gfo/Idh/MocA family oxidoreductase [Candidatus Hydrogenedentota bacterium]